MFYVKKMIKPDKLENLESEMKMNNLVEITEVGGGGVVEKQGLHIDLFW